MFKIISSRLLCASALSRHLPRHCDLLRVCRANYIRGYWPEPISQQTWDKFLQDINYFEQPKEFVNIGLQNIESERTESNQSKLNAARSDKSPGPTKKAELQQEKPDPEQVDDILNLLSVEAELPTLNVDDTILPSQQLLSLAVGHGIYRDLFGTFQPRMGHIRFTEQQANNLKKLVPHHWITDQPFARVERNPKEAEPLDYFEPVVGISARFVHACNNSNEQFAHTSYHGNIIPAVDAMVKPSIALDGFKLSSSLEDQRVKESQFSNWSPGHVSMENFDGVKGKYYSVIFLNLDSFHQDHANLHWMITNITAPKTGKSIKYDEICEFLPVHGIRGFGYSRYVFLVLQHDSKLDSKNLKITGFSPQCRKFDAKKFIGENASSNVVPVGLSWFQTVWDISSNGVFHDYLQMKSPVYEHVQQKHEDHMSDITYPGRIPFNIFLDHRRDRKETNERVLLERLKTVDPFDYRDQYVLPKVPPTIHEDQDAPSWMRSVLFKKKNKIGVWRGLRPASAILPLDNNADLDYPLRPLESSKRMPPGFHNKYNGRIIIKKLKDLPYNKPANEYTSTFVQEGHENHIDRVNEFIRKSEQKAK